MPRSLLYNSFGFFVVLFLFTLPFGGYVPSMFAALCFFNSFFLLSKESLLKGLKNRNFILMELFFLLTFVSALLSSNKTEAFSAIEVKLSFLGFPFVIFCVPWNPDLIKRSIVAFVSGSFFSCIYLLLRASYFAAKGQPEYFFYTKFSDLIHASYFSMYLILCIGFIFLFYKDWFKQRRDIIYLSWFFVLVFVVCIFLSSSKAGLISLLVCSLILLFYKNEKYLKLKFVIPVVALLGVLLFAGIKYLPGPFERMNSIISLSPENVDKTSSESTSVRVVIWNECAKLIKSNFLFGTGVGDANDTLYVAYAENGLSGALKHHLNAHNQFLQTFLGMGILGFVLLFSLTIIPLYFFVKRKNLIAFIFTFLILVNFLVESMLQTAAGVLFFSFFYCFFNRFSQDEIRGE